MITDSQGYLDLVSSDYYLFPKLKEFDGKIFGFNNEIIAQKDAHFEDLMNLIIWNGSKKWKSGGGDVWNSKKTTFNS